MMKSKSSILSEEERSILILASRHPGAKHLTNSEIGQRLGISVSRVKTVLHQACAKLGAHNRNEVVFLAMDRGEINLNELLSLEELAEILSSVKPSVLRGIANQVRQNQVVKPSREKMGPNLHPGGRQAGLLTNRERDVLILVARGFTNLEIAERLCMSNSAVRTFLNRGFNKLGVRRRADAIELALKRKEIRVEEITSLDELAYFLAPLGAQAIEKMAQVLEDKGG